MTCPECNGRGGRYEVTVWDGYGGGPYEPCWLCKGNGTISFVKRIWFLWISRNW